MVKKNRKDKSKKSKNIFFEKSKILSKDFHLKKNRQFFPTKNVMTILNENPYWKFWFFEKNIFWISIFFSKYFFDHKKIKIFDEIFFKSSSSDSVLSI